MPTAFWVTEKQNAKSNSNPAFANKTFASPAPPGGSGQTLHRTVPVLGASQSIVGVSRRVELELELEAEAALRSEVGRVSHDAKAACPHSHPRQHQSNGAKIAQIEQNASLIGRRRLTDTSVVANVRPLSSTCATSLGRATRRDAMQRSAIRTRHRNTYHDHSEARHIRFEAARCFQFSAKLLSHTQHSRREACMFCPPTVLVVRGAMAGQPTHATTPRPQALSPVRFKRPKCAARTTNRHRTTSSKGAMSTSRSSPLKVGRRAITHPGGI